MIEARVLVLFVFPFLLGSSEDPFAGVWKLNLSKSKLTPPLPKSQTVRVEVDGPAIRITEEIVSETGERLNISVDARFDGKDYPIQGAPFADSVSYERVDRFTIKGVGKKDGKVVMHETVVVSADGKTVTGTYSGTDATGKQVTAVAVFDKQ
jgi:hypothetical protein